MTVILGMHNATEKIFYWEVDEDSIGRSEMKVGDYAIVENKADYDLVKIIGIMDTDKKYLKHFDIPTFGRVKRAVIVVPRKYVRED